MSKNVKLIHNTPLWIVARAIRMSKATLDKSDSFMIAKDLTKITCKCGSRDIYEIDNTKLKCANCLQEVDKQEHIGSKDIDLIKRVGVHYNHSSTLEFSHIVFNVKLSTKALLEWTRSRVGVSYCVTSSRYALDKMGIHFEPTGDSRIDSALNEIQEIIKDEMQGKTKRDFDNLAMLLPQAFMYEMQVGFNLRSLMHFLELRLSKSAHKTIRVVANEILDKLPSDYKEIVLENKTIAKNKF